MTRAVRTRALSVASAFATVLLAVLADRFIVGPIAPPELLIFPPHAEYRYRTSEFSAVARTNAMGFRDREFTPREECGTTRILAIGVPEMLTSVRSDEPIRRASEQAGVAFVSCVGEFRRAAAARMLFFALDGHFNRAGHDVFSTLVEPAVAARVSALRHAAR